MEEVLKELLSRRERSLINDEGLRQSAVLVPLFTKDGSHHILFIRRSQKVEHHKGEISFPGGSVKKMMEGWKQQRCGKHLRKLDWHPTM